MRPTADARLCAALAADLSDAGYTSDALRSAWTTQGDEAIGRGLVSPALRALGDRDDPLAVLARVLGLGVAVPRPALDDALPRTRAGGVEHLGLVQIVDDVVHARALVRPQAFVDEHGDGEWWIASDLDEAALGGALPEDHVLGVGGASQTLLRLQLPAAAGTALDLGTGCGVQALRLARGGAHAVVATDVSERALRFTELNALLNGVGAIETRSGSLFDPVDAQQFARIVSNPPFVITPRVDGVPAYEYRDAGRVGDGLVAEVVTGAGARLVPGGVFQALGNWEYRDGEEGLDRVRRWVSASDVVLDAWIVERERLEPLAYAELWVRDGGTAAGTREYTRLIDAWLDDFTARGVSAVGFGYVLLHRPPSGVATLSRYERIDTAAAVDGAHLAASLAAHARLSAMDDDVLGAAFLRVAPDVTEARHHRPGEENPLVIELRQGGGFGRVLSVDPALAALVGASDGDLPIDALISAIADLLDADPVALRADLMPRIRELLFTGFLVFAD